MKKQKGGLNRYNVLHDRWRTLVCPTTPLLIGACDGLCYSIVKGLPYNCLVKSTVLIEVFLVLFKIAA